MPNQSANLIEECDVRSGLAFRIPLTHLCDPAPEITAVLQPPCFKALTQHFRQRTSTKPPNFIGQLILRSHYSHPNLPQLQHPSKWLEARARASAERAVARRTLLGSLKSLTQPKLDFNSPAAVSSVSSRTTLRTRCASALKLPSMSLPSSNT